QVLGLERLRLAELQEMDRDRRVAVLDQADRATEPNAITELGGERVGHQLIAALEPVDLALEDGQAAPLHDRRLPDAEQGRDLVVASGLGAIPAAQAVEPDGSVAGPILGEQLAGRDRVEMIEANAEGLIFVLDHVDVGPEIEHRQLGPATPEEEL